MVCDKIVKNLKEFSFIITKEDIENALYSSMQELQKHFIIRLGTQHAFSLDFNVTDKDRKSTYYSIARDLLRLQLGCPWLTSRWN